MDFPELYQKRWSPREYTAKPVDKRLLEEIFSAARMAQSSFNEQPWRYLIAAKTEQPIRGQIESLLVEVNAFAKEAGILGVSFAKQTFTTNQKPNRVAVHDLGAANQVIALKAYELGLNTRFMAGFDTERAQALAPPDFAPVAMFVIGYAAEKVLKAGPGDRGRHAPSRFVFGGGWGKGYF